MAQSVFLKKDQKIADVVSSLSPGYSEDDFIRKFRERYPDDWKKIEKRYQEQRRNHKPGESAPMPKPEKYLSNALKVWQKKQSE